MSILETIGNTPLVQISHDGNAGVKLYAKLEGNNPGGSVKDRAALNMIRSAMKSGQIQKGDTLIEATSGNTGIALAMVSQIVGLNLIIVMPENSTEERKKTMLAYGAKLILTPSDKTIEYSRVHANELASKLGYKQLDQFSNHNNWQAHFQTTGPEIWKQTDEKITHFVSAMGTTGTIMGVTRYLREKSSSIITIGAQPKEGAKIPGIRKWSNEFRPKFYTPEEIDLIENVSQEEATIAARRLAKQEGILAGMSSGGAYHIAKGIADTINEGVIVFIVCDRGDRYLSSNLFG